MVCGERGIRTPGPVARTTVFKTAAIDHSAISPLTLPGCRPRKNEVLAGATTKIVSGCKYNVFLYSLPEPGNYGFLPFFRASEIRRGWAFDTGTNAACVTN